MKTVSWENKPFIKRHYFALFYMPLGLDGILKELMEDLKSKDLLADKPPGMIWRNEGMFGGDVYLAIKKEDPNYKTEKISGTFFTMLFEGKDYKEVSKWFQVFKDETLKRGKNVKEIMSYYTICPHCQKKFHKIQAVLFGRL